MAISMQCPACGRSHQWDDAMAGRQATCPCGQTIPVRRAAPASGAAVPDGQSPLLPGGLGEKSRPSIVAIGAGAFVLVLLVVLAIRLAARPAENAGGAGGTKPAVALGGFATPQAAFEANKRATLAKDWGAQIRVWTPESRAKLAGAVAYFALAMAKSKPEIGEVLKKHGIGESLWEDESPAVEPGNFAEMAQRFRHRQKQLAAAIDDMPAFYAEIVPRMEAIGKEMAAGPGGANMAQRQAEAEQAQAGAELADVQIDGDTAVGMQTFSVRGQAINVPAHFKKIDDRWYMHQPESTPPEPTPAAAGSPAAVPAGASVRKFTVTAKIEGMDKLQVFRDHAKWNHIKSEVPREVRLNGISWNPRQEPELAFDQATKDLLANVAFPRARLLKTKGRGRVMLGSLEDQLKIGFEDVGAGADEYEVVIWFEEAE